MPTGTATNFDWRFAMLDPASLTSLTRVTSRKGESMVSIARRNKMTSKQLGWYNPKVARLKSGNLVTGQAILVPTAAVLAAARDVPNPEVARYPRRARSRPATRPGAATTATAKPAPKPPARRP